jgi:hypothetical protein
MLEKLVTHEVEYVYKLFSLANKCARAAEGRAWHSQPTHEAGKVGKPEVDAAAQSSGKIKNRKKKKSNNNNKPLEGSPTTAAVAAATDGDRGPCHDKRSRQTSSSDEGGPRCPVHNSRRHSRRGVSGDQEAHEIVP